MEISSPTARQIINEMQELRRRDELMGKAFDIGSERIQKLQSGGFYLEAFIVNVQIVEHLAKLVLAGYATQRRVLHLVGEKDVHDGAKLEFDDDVPLGAMIGTLKRVGMDTATVIRLNEFNALRRQAIHHIFDGRNDVERFEEKIKSYMRSEDYKEMVMGIAEAQDKVSDQVRELVKSFR